VDKTHAACCGTPLVTACALQQGAFVAAVMGGFSGGTIQSFVTYMRDRNSDPKLAKILAHPYSLIPEFPYMSHRDAEALPDKGGKWRPQWSEAAQQWGGPFVMQFHNEKIVRMSNALLGWRLGALPLVCTTVSDSCMWR
jgi:short subunit dehydrogenase-like uncharacterized protein